MWDVFISHASEDKNDVARPLAQKLGEQGIKVWFDEMTLKLGDSLRQSIDKGLAESRFGVVILSPGFFAKSWTQYELDGLVTRELASGKTILPVWHRVTQQDVMRFSPSLANKLAVSTDQGLDHVVRQIMDVVRPDVSYGSSASSTYVPESSAVADKRALVRILAERFNLSELRSLAFDLDVDVDDLGGSSKNEKALELVQWMDRRGRLPELARTIRQVRPDTRF
jgi:hypothetical protein